jgi:predicted O-methyltransferase YrrM
MFEFDYLSSLEDTDKFRGSILLDAKAGHNYKNLYNSVFITKPETILEIGTASCGFAKFLRDNKIGKFLVGADLTKGIISHHIPSKLIWCDLFDDFYEGDVSLDIFLDWLRNKQYSFDLIIDDASHESSLQKHLVNTCTQFLSPKGVYIIEDIISHEVAVDVFSSIPTHLRSKASIYNASLSINRSDDICIIIDLR